MPIYVCIDTLIGMDGLENRAPYGKRPPFDSNGGRFASDLEAFSRKTSTGKGFPPAFSLEGRLLISFF